MMKNFRFDLYRALDRVGDETVLFGFFQDARHAREIVGGRKDDLWLNDNLGNLIASSLDLL